ncbi:MAG TPA: MBL fold metallo-hydrolase [Myxococcota bacterium]|nr:MBL fold metallo-hydrolase [Myxococcota bacterium]
MTEVVCIGTSDAFGAGGRRQSAYLLRAAAGGLLLDCGPTTASGLASLGIERGEIDAIAVSHYHGDHFGGIPSLLLAAEYGDGRRRPLHVAGPGAVEAHVRAAAAALGHPLEGRSFGFELHFHELRAGAPLRLAGFELEAFATHHVPESCPHGLSCRVDGRTLVFSGDTGWFDGLPGAVGDPDLFLCECTLDRHGYPYHLSLEELTANRRSLRAQRTVLTHLGPEMRARDRYEGFEAADDGLVLKL